MSEFIEHVKEVSRNKRNSIIPIPVNCVVDKNHLGSLSNDEFVNVFIKLQHLIISMYDDIEKDPIAWGFPEEPKTKTQDYNRLTETLFALMTSGKYSENAVTIDTTLFIKAVKAFKNMEQTLKSFEKFGFSINNFNIRTSAFDISHTNNELLRILHLYENLWDVKLPHWSYYYPSLERFSHRWIEDKFVQTHEMIFLATLDEYSNELKEMQYWLYEQAKKYGFSIDSKTPHEKGCLRYCKGSKGFFLIGEKEIDGKVTIFSKTIFRKSFDLYNDKMSALINLFPDTFGSNKNSECKLCNGSRSADDNCSTRIIYNLNGKTYKNCSYNSFYFFNLNNNNVKELFDMYIRENKIKQII